MYATAFPGDTLLLVRGYLDWNVGDSVVLTSSSFKIEEYDTARVVSTTWLTEGVTRVIIDTPLRYLHVAATVSNLTAWYLVQSEIGVVTRVLTIESGDEKDEAYIVYPDNVTSKYQLTEAMQYGARVHIVGGVLPDLSQDYPANVTMQYVQCVRCGQAGYDRRDAVEIGAPGYLRPIRGYPYVVVEGCVLSVMG